MAALDFPDSPALGEVFGATGGVNWQWDGTRWRVAGSSTPSSSGVVARGSYLATNMALPAATTTIVTNPLSVRTELGRLYRLTATSQAVGPASSNTIIRPKPFVNGVNLDAGGAETLMFVPGPTGFNNMNVSFLVPGTGTVRTFDLRVYTDLAVTMYFAPGLTAFYMEDITFQPGSGGSGGGTGGFTFVQDVTPSGAIHGSTWLDTSTGISFVYVDDGNSKQWVQFAPSASGPQLTMYQAALGVNTTMTTTAQVLASVTLPAAPPGALLDISHTSYCNTNTAGTGSGFITMWVNGVSVGPTTVVMDSINLMTYSGRVVNVAQPTAGPFVVELKAQKAAAGGNLIMQATNTTLSVVSVYR